MTSPIINPDGHVWMEHDEHGGRAQLPDTPFWRAQGWKPVDGPPPEPDLTKDPQLRDQPDAAPEATESPEDSSGLSAVQPQSTAKTWSKTEEK